MPWHKHDDTEQVMYILEGEVEMTIEDETTRCGPATSPSSTAACITSSSQHGVTFMEALSPVPLDHVQAPSTWCSAPTAARSTWRSRMRSCAWSCSSGG